MIVQCQVLLFSPNFLVLSIYLVNEKLSKRLDCQMDVSLSLSLSLSYKSCVLFFEFYFILHQLWYVNVEKEEYKFSVPLFIFHFMPHQL